MSITRTFLGAKHRLSTVSTSEKTFFSVTGKSHNINLIQQSRVHIVKRTLVSNSYRGNFPKTASHNSINQQRTLVVHNNFKKFRHAPNDAICKNNQLRTATTLQSFPLEKVAIIGNGNWASAISINVAKNCERLPFCDNQVKMWVYEEEIPLNDSAADTKKTKKLSSIINTRHENVKYLPGRQLPANIKAIPNLHEVCHDATLLIFCLPHQFLPNLLPTISEAITSNQQQQGSIFCRGISLIKGLDFDPVEKRPKLVSELIEKKLNKDTNNSNNTKFQCGVLMGANVANEVALGRFCESTLACNFDSLDLNERTRQIFHREDVFRVQHISDVAGAEVCGALKNVFALGCGFIDGIEEGNNAKAALIRVGLIEMGNFCHLFFNNNCNNSTDDSTGFNLERNTYVQSCGIADLITTCYGGRNRRCAEAFARHQLETRGSTDNTLQEADVDKKEYCQKIWEKIEVDVLKGQKLQGTLALEEAYSAIQSKGVINDFPLIKTIYDIAFKGKPVETITNGIIK